MRLGRKLAARKHFLTDFCISCLPSSVLFLTRRALNKNQKVLLGTKRIQKKITKKYILPKHFLSDFCNSCLPSSVLFLTHRALNKNQKKYFRNQKNPAKTQKIYIFLRGNAPWKWQIESRFKMTQEEPITRCKCDAPSQICHLQLPQRFWVLI